MYKLKGIILMFTLILTSLMLTSCNKDYSVFSYSNKTWYMGSLTNGDLSFTVFEDSDVARGFIRKDSEKINILVGLGYKLTIRIEEDGVFQPASKGIITGKLKYVSSKLVGTIEVDNYYDGLFVGEEITLYSSDINEFTISDYSNYVFKTKDDFKVKLFLYVGYKFSNPNGYVKSSWGFDKIEYLDNGNRFNITEFKDDTVIASGTAELNDKEIRLVFDAPFHTLNHVILYGSNTGNDFSQYNRSYNSNL